VFSAWYLPRCLRELSVVERVVLKKISFEFVVVENLVEFWRWQSKVIKKKWQDMN
jgi:hypothetical protein